MDLHLGPVMLLGPTLEPKTASDLHLRIPHLGVRMAEHSRRALAYAQRLAMVRSLLGIWTDYSCCSCVLSLWGVLVIGFGHVHTFRGRLSACACVGAKAHAYPICASVASLAGAMRLHRTAASRRMSLGIPLKETFRLQELTCTHVTSRVDVSLVVHVDSEKRYG